MNSSERSHNREMLDWSIAYSKERMQQILESSDTSLDLKRVLIGTHIKKLLQDSMKMLPKKRQQELQACLDLYEQVWHVERPPAKTKKSGSLSTWNLTREP